MRAVAGARAPAPCGPLRGRGAHRSGCGATAARRRRRRRAPAAAPAAKCAARAARRQSDRQRACGAPAAFSAPASRPARHRRARERSRSSRGGLVLRLWCAAVVAAAAMLAARTGASAHQGNPNFRSEVRALTPAIDGLERAGRQLRRQPRAPKPQRTDGGRRGLPRRAVRADRGRRHGGGQPSLADLLPQRRPLRGGGHACPPARHPRRRRTGRRSTGPGRYAWHDHRIHWMAHTLPPQVKDEGKRTKVFDWKVPMEVGGRPATIAGSLIWVGKQGGGFPVAAAISLVRGGARRAGAGRGRRAGGGARPAAAASAEEAW